MSAIGAFNKRVKLGPSHSTPGLGNGAPIQIGQNSQPPIEVVRMVMELPGREEWLQSIPQFVPGIMRSGLDEFSLKKRALKQVRYVHALDIVRGNLIIAIQFVKELEAYLIETGSDNMWDYDFETALKRLADEWRVAGIVKTPIKKNQDKRVAKKEKAMTFKMQSDDKVLGIFGPTMQANDHGTMMFQFVECDPVVQYNLGQTNKEFVNRPTGLAKGKFYLPQFVAVHHTHSSTTILQRYYEVERENGDCLSRHPALPSYVGYCVRNLGMEPSLVHGKKQQSNKPLDHYKMTSLPEIVGRQQLDLCYFMM